MLNICFLNVNQGDSLIVNWISDTGETEYLIVDCNKTLEGNKTIDYLISNNVKRIKYIILSHFHHDHYSGLIDLLEYCYSTKIGIEWFLFTGKFQPDYVIAITRNSIQATSYIKNLLTLVFEYEKNGYLQTGSLEENPSQIKLNSSLHIKVLSPSKYEDTFFLKNIKTEDYSNSDVKNHPAANWLSTVLKIVGKDWYILLTSDTNKQSLVRLDKQRKIGYDGRKLILGQSAHHGALSSHNDTFWKRVSTPKANQKIVFSVGTNGYNHPNKDVVSFFKSQNFDIYSTNEIGELSIIPTVTPISKSTTQSLNVFGQASTRIPNTKLNGDKFFNVDEHGNITVY